MRTVVRPTAAHRRERTQLSARLAEAELIRGALEQERFLVLCQPILELGRNEVSRYELLVRLRVDGGGEPLQPSSFLYVAERFGLIQEIDCWVARQAIALIAEQASAGRRLVLHSNLSGKSIGDPQVAALIEKAVEDAAIDPVCLVFELTETAAIANIEEAKDLAHRLHTRGCQLALDDFGAGLGSFYYLKALPFDYFMIHGDFGGRSDGRAPQGRRGTMVLAARVHPPAPFARLFANSWLPCASERKVMHGRIDGRAGLQE